MPNMDGILLGPGPLAIAVTKPYSSSYLWKNGEYCTQNGKIYKFISTDLEETGETWTPAHWAETKLTDEIIGLGQRIDSLDPESGVGLFTDIAFEINTNQWVEDSTNGVWNYNYSNSLIKATSGIAVYYDNSYATALSGHISVTKNTGYVTFTTNGQPQNRLTGTLRIVDSVSGVLPVSSGGTGAVTSKGARTNLNVSIKPICVNFGTVSSLPQTLTDINNPLYADINANMIPSKWVFGNPAACPNGLKCTTAAGAVTISLPDANSTFSGETTVYLELVDPQTSADSGTGMNNQQYTGDFVQIGAQSLTATQKAQARTNIGAANAEDVSEISKASYIADATTLAMLRSNILSFVSNMEDNSNKSIGIWIGETGFDCFKRYTTYTGIIHRVSNSVFNGFVYSTRGDSVHISYNEGLWYIGALNELLVNLISSCTAVENKSYFGSINGTIRSGHTVQVSAVVIIDADIQANEDIISLPYEAAYNGLYIYGWKDGTNDFQMFNIDGQKLKCPTLIASGSIIRLGFTYVCKP